MHEGNRLAVEEIAASAEKDAKESYDRSEEIAREGQNR